MPATVLEVSASERLAGTGPARDWQALADRLATLAKQSGAGLVHAAEERGAQFFAKRIIRELTEQRDALVRPLEESQRRLDDLRACVAEAERSLGDLAFLFDAEEARLAGEFARWAAEFLRRALPDARDQFLRALDVRQSRGKMSLRPDAFAAAQEADAIFVDAGPLGREAANAARSERSFTHDGVAGHPGDRGMKALADAIVQAVLK